MPERSGAKTLKQSIMKRAIEFLQNNGLKLIATLALGALCIHHGATDVSFLIACAIGGIWTA